MRRQFTPGEWDEIKSPDSELDQLATFYRFWVRLRSSTIVSLPGSQKFDLHDLWSFSVAVSERKLREGSWGRGRIQLAKNRLQDSFQNCRHETWHHGY